MEVTPYNLISKHPQEYFHVIKTKDVLSTCQGNPSIVPDARRSGVNLLFLLIPSPWLFMPGSKLFHRGGRRRCPHRPKSRSGQKSCKYGGPSLHYTDGFSPNSGQGLIFLAPHLGIHVLVELRCHFYKGKTLVNTYPSMYKGVNTDEPNMYSFFLQYLCYARHREMGSYLGNRTQGSTDLQDRPNSQLSWHTLLLFQHDPVLAFELRTSLNCEKNGKKS